MDKSQKVFMDYIIALQHKQYDKVIKILTDLVNEIDPNEEQLIDCIKCHTGAFFRYEKYDGVMEDCRKLRLLKYNIEEDQDTAAMESISEYRLACENIFSTPNFVDFFNKFPL